MLTVKSVGRIARRDGGVQTISSGATAVDAACRMREAQVGSLLVLNANGTVVGIVTEHDLAIKIVASGTSPAVGVAEIMTRAVISCLPGTTAEQAQRIMAVHNIRHLPIVEDGQPLGMVSSRDILARQLSAAKAVVQRQSKVLRQLETEYPGITAIEKDRAGRVVI